MSKELDDILKMRDRLNAISPSFCLAKWLQVTIHLQNGMTHSCHHPNTHKIPTQDLSADPSTLHNTPLKKKYRKMMLEGQRPPECQYCWNIEDTPGNNISDRYIKSNDNWANTQIDKIAKAPWNQNVTPTYVEVSFSNVCNFKCAYCAPHISSKWMQEIEKWGPYPTSPHRFNDLKVLEAEGKLPLVQDQNKNPYVEAFWKWWPALYKELKVFRITGGEPFLAKDTFEVLNFVNENPNPDLSLAINSNLGVPFKLIEKFATLAEPILDAKKVRNLTLFTSVDTFGDQAQYIRHGLDFEYFISNVEYLLNRLKSLQIVIMCTYNALSVTGFAKLLHKVAEIRRKYSGPERSCGSPFILDISYLRQPEFLSVKILTDDFIEIQERHLQTMNDLSEATLKVPHAGFYPYEIAKMKRLTDWMKCSDPGAEKTRNQANFYRYFSEYDRRRGTEFLKTFPELSGFWDLCKSRATSGATEDSKNSGPQHPIADGP